MNKTIITSLVGIVIVGAVVAILVTRPNTPSPDTHNSTLSEQTADKKMAFGDFVKKGGSYQCTVNQYIDSSYTATIKGTVYISQGNIRGNYTTQVQGMSIDTSVIVRDGFAYTWTNMMPTGYKVPVATDTPDKTSASTTTSQGTFSWNNALVGDYDCTPWAADAAMFTLPAQITFTTI